MGVSAFALGQLWTGPATTWEKLVAFGAISGVALVFFSVLVDRLRVARTDRYRGVKK